MPFQTEELELIAAAREVLIETRSGDRVYRTVIWVSADDETLYIRSFLGESGRWYQRALIDPKVALISGDARVVFSPIPATDAASVRRASEGFRRKYPDSRSLDAMVVPEVLHTTLRLEPAS